MSKSAVNLKLNVEMRSFVKGGDTEKDVLFASKKVPVETLKANTEGNNKVSFELDIVLPEIGTGTGGPRIVLTAQRIDGDERRVSQHVGSKSKTVYFVRHGESLWNEAQDNCLLWKMPGLYDAPLSEKGRTQCSTHLLQNVVRSNNTAFDAFLANSTSSKKRVIFSSPLTRAMETAVIGFQDYMGSGDKCIDELVLLPS